MANNVNPDQMFACMLYAEKNDVSNFMQQKTLADETLICMFFSDRWTGGDTYTLYLIKFCVINLG